MHHGFSKILPSFLSHMWMHFKKMEAADVKATLYIHNLNDRIKRKEMKRQLYLICSQYGRVLQVSMFNAPKMRGQAFLSFQEPEVAAVAHKALNDFVFFGKALKVEFAKRDSTSIGVSSGQAKFGVEASLIGSKRTRSGHIVQEDED